MKKLKVGLIGAGFMGKAHVVAYSNMPKFFWPAPAVPVLKTVCDIEPEIAKDAKDRFGFEGYCTDWHDVINDPEIDIVSICTPNNVHAEIAIAALKAGKHVLCEKPISSTSEDAKAMADAAEEVKKDDIISMCAYQYRRVPAIVLAKKFIDEGSIGKILNVRATYLQSWSADPNSPLSWRFQKKIAGAGTLGDIASHVIDISQYLAGDIKEVVSTVETYIKERPVQEGGVDLLGTVKLGADAKRVAVDVDDENLFLVKFKNGAVGSIEATRNAWGRNNFITFEVHGTEGSIAFNYERLNELQVCFAKDPDDRRGFKTIYTGPAHFYGEVTWNIPGMNIGYGELKTIEIYEFIKAIVEKKQPSTCFEEGYKVEKVCAAVLKSITTSQWEKID
ncbi:Gfo/Idh/MocA family protein [Clostridium beijerinckii]|uniref:Gfo/Idh/MocA family oxidoreductase n=1 Tax=Clostridium beijerinckii TaxID=1520 RepID=A0AAW3W9B9_CLOBE|nr:Gfo/Idh/MocA family oxidoreductase [Clostridium beijerinckii]MBC2457735.1 Gfo/Idh/MocA family oxidoreductase [Clostridium beijerinckii]MBC2475073.1 Gfo/Idh/MocA family oxidoreductase [Clostridium beijerinckii]NOV63542.1 putative dehydrogenase [Clostridium beijerinckii]NOV73264.1 putative dehydrogenase [Clostridium beijerinckii]NOW35402.1 putative dehydrogenase [Clostridium beijerinckii]